MGDCDEQKWMAYVKESTLELEKQKDDVRVEGVFNLNKEVMRCLKDDHDNARLKFLCTDSSCRCEIKLACAECILNDHKEHKYVALENFALEIRDKFVKMNRQQETLEREN